MYKFIFDVDGTLTPSRASINPDFKEFFLEFCRFNSVTLVTGSDIAKTVEQLGEEITELVDTVYCCSGNDVWAKGKNIRSSTWTLPIEVRHWLENKLSNSNFVLRTGNHLEERPGCLNFSILGRNATLKERQLYKSWDESSKERETLVELFNGIFTDICAKIGGETGIDIYPKGFDKSQIVKDFSVSDKLLFFGDKMDILGNDYPLKIKIENNNLGSCFEVKDWEHTKKILYVMKVMQ
jgi:phosphomannomutase